MMKEVAKLKFVWDEQKEKLNIKNHGVSFSVAAKIWHDTMRIERYDAAHSATEDRWQTIGESDGLLFVVYTERGEETRIISARIAEAPERRIYYGTSTLQLGPWYRVDP